MKIVLALCSVIFLLSCTPSSKKNETATPNQLPEKWQGSMQDLALTLNKLAPYVYSQEKFQNPRNRGEIENLVQDLVTISSKVREMHSAGKVSNLDADPSMPLIAASFAKETGTALDSFRSGNRDYAQSVLKNATGLCVQCHTRGTFGPEFRAWGKYEDDPSLTKLEQAEILSATRQYDRALQIYQGILSDANIAKNNIFQWERAARSALNISIRVHQNADEAAGVVNTILKTPGGTWSLKSEALEWQKSIGKWKEEKPSSDRLKTARKILKEANAGGTLDKKHDYAAYLRASALLHDFLREKTSVAKQAEAYYLLGRTYEVVQEQRYWNLNEVYYKACIFKLPHSALARTCFENYEDSLMAGAMRSENLGLSSLNEYLEYLKDLAGPKK